MPRRIDSFKLYEWNEIKANYRSGLVIGNGTSIAFSLDFLYDNLFDKSILFGHLESRFKRIFDEFDTKNFERILYFLLITNKVNYFFNKGNTDIDNAYAHIQSALIRTVRKIHENVLQEVTVDKLKAASKFLSRFNTIASLNYDILVYRAMMLGNNQGYSTYFKDCFVNGVFQQNWSSFRKPLGNFARSTLVFYPHGNLILAKDINGLEFKISSPNSGIYLLEEIFQKWGNRFTPLFINEGNSQEKLEGILCSNYLSTVYKEVLPNIGSSVVFLGLSLENDEHILKAICNENRLNKIAFSIDGNLSDSKISGICSGLIENVKSVSRNRDFNIEFFNWRSSGCWINS